MADFHILSLLPLWRDEEISAFWIDLYERLKENQIAIESLSSPENKALIGISKAKNDKTGWVEKIGNPVGEYLTQIETISGNKPPNTKSVFQLLKAFRNLASHKFGCDVISRTLQEQKQYAKKAAEEAETAAKSLEVEMVANEVSAMKPGAFEDSVLEAAAVKALAVDAAIAVEATEAAVAQLNQLKENVDEQFKEGRVKFWLENFPEFSLIACIAGYDASLYFHQVDLEDIPDSCKPQYISVPKPIKTKSKQLSLHAYSKSLSSWINEEIGNGKTAIWKHSFTSENGNFTFLAIPDNSAVSLANRELMTLNWTPDNLGQTYTLQISRSLVSTCDEVSWLFKKNRTTQRKKQNDIKSINLEFVGTSESKTNDSFPFIAFSDVLPAALQACFNLTSEGTPRVIFTNQPIDNIKSVVDQFCKSRHIKYCSNSISWNELHTAYKTELVEESFPLHEHSNVNLKLIEICNFEVTKRSNLAINPGTSLGTSTHSKVNTKSGSSSGETHNVVNDSFSDINSMLLELMHDKSWLVDTFIESQENYISRNVSLNLGAPINQKKIIAEVLKKSVLKSKNFYLISGAACIGKSTFLAELGHSLVCNDQLVIFTTCLKINSLIEQNITDFVDILYRHNKFQQRVAQYVLKSQRYALTIIIDNFQDLNDKERSTLFTNFLIPFLNEYKDLVINIFLAARSNKILGKNVSKVYFENNTACTVNYLELKGLGNNQWENHMKSLFPTLNKSCSTVSNYVKDCMQFIKDEYRQLADTPFACKIIAEICHDLEIKSQGFLDTEKLSGPYFYEKYHNMHLREAIAKVLQNHDVSNEFKLIRETLNMGSSIFLLFKEASEKQLGHESFKVRLLDCNLKLEERKACKTDILISDTLIDLVRLSETFVPDYYCALFIFNSKNFVTGEVFDFNNKTKAGLKYYRILSFLDILLHEQKSKPDFTNILDVAIQDIHHSLFLLIHKELYYVFFEAVEMSNGTFHGDDKIWIARRNDIEHLLNDVMTGAIKSNALNAIKFLVEQIKFDWDKFKKRGKSFQIDKINATVDYAVLQYLLVVVANKTNLVSDDFLKSLIIKYLTKIYSSNC